MKLLHGAEQEMKENQLTEGGLTSRRLKNKNSSQSWGIFMLAFGPQVLIIRC